MKYLQDFSFIAPRYLSISSFFLASPSTQQDDGTTKSDTVRHSGQALFSKSVTVPKPALLITRLQPDNLVFEAFRLAPASDALEAKAVLATG